MEGIGGPACPREEGFTAAWDPYAACIPGHSWSSGGTVPPRDSNPGPAPWGPPLVACRWKGLGAIGPVAVRPSSSPTAPLHSLPCRDAPTDMPAPTACSWAPWQPPA